MRNLAAAFAILLIPFWLSAQSPLDKEVDFGVDNASLQTILDKLGTESGVNFTYAKAIIPNHSFVSFKSENRTVGEVLDIVLDGLPLAIKLVGDQIVIYRDEALFRKSLKFTISGTIEDANTGERLIGTHIFTPEFKGTNHDV